MSETKPAADTTTDTASAPSAVDRRQLIRLSAAGALALGAVNLVEGDALAATPEASPSASPTASPGASPIVALPDLTVEQVAIVTGDDPAAISQTGKNWSVYGTDLGSSFRYKDETWLVFGDTFGEYKRDWRSNVLGVSTDADPTDGVTIDRMIEDAPGHAKEILASRKVDFDEMTVIPTYGVAVGDRLFLHSMSVSHWGEPGHWDLGAAGFAYSDDAGQTWTKDPDAILPGDTNWGQVAIEEHDGHLYLFGIPGGRYGDLKLARVVPESLLDFTTWEYWNGSDWSPEVADSAVIVPGPVGELSVRWNSHYQRWLMMYLIDDAGLIVLRTAETIAGPWSDARVVVRSTDYPALYAPFLYPTWNDGPDIWFNMSLFGPYNVFLMRTHMDAAASV